MALYSPRPLLIAAVLLAGLAPAVLAGRPARSQMIRRVYPVADLVVPLVDQSPEILRTGGKEAAPRRTEEERLIAMLIETVAPDSWAGRGGRGTVEYFPLGMALVIHQPPALQEQVADLLAALRRLQDVQVSVEVRIVSIPPGGFERVGIDFKAPKPVALASRQIGPDGFERVGIDFEGQGEQVRSVLNDRQVAALLEAVQGDKRSSVWQTPKLTVANGQMANLDVTEGKNFVTGVEVGRDGRNPVLVPKSEEIRTGLRLAVRPAVSADRRFVRLELGASWAHLDDKPVPLVPVTTLLKPVGGDGPMVPFTQYIQQPTVHTFRADPTLTVPDGGTVVLGGWTREWEMRSESGPPVLSKIPYVNRLFRNVGYAREVEQVYLLVTPRVIVAEEVEKRQTSVAAEAEEQEPPARPSGAAKAARLVARYRQACAAGDTARALKLAVKALALDPACFSGAAER